MLFNLLKIDHQDLYHDWLDASINFQSQKKVGNGKLWISTLVKENFPSSGSKSGLAAIYCKE